jgi:hypothetical protein
MFYFQCQQKCLLVKKLRGGACHRRPPLLMREYSVFLLHAEFAGSRLQIQRSRVRFPVPPDCLRNSGPGTGSTQSHEQK